MGFRGSNANPLSISPECLDSLFPWTWKACFTLNLTKVAVCWILQRAMIVFKSCHSPSIFGCRTLQPFLTSVRLEFRRKRNIMNTHIRDLLPSLMPLLSLSWWGSDMEDFLQSASHQWCPHTYLLTYSFMDFELLLGLKSVFYSQGNVLHILPKGCVFILEEQKKMFCFVLFCLFSPTIFDS